jgi:hypothetical protein
LTSPLRCAIIVLGRGGIPGTIKLEGEIDMEIVTQKVDMVTVQVERTVMVGQTLRINPSEAFQGLYGGVITVIGIVDTGNLDPDVEEIALIDTQDLISQIEVDKDQYLDGYEHEEYDEELARLDSQPWVVFLYESNPYVEREWYALPLYEFIEHTMHY